MTLSFSSSGISICSGISRKVERCSNSPPNTER